MGLYPRADIGSELCPLGQRHHFTEHGFSAVGGGFEINHGGEMGMGKNRKVNEEQNEELVGF
jgi:hypothetical protein